MAVLSAQRVCAGYGERTVIRDIDLNYDRGLHLLLGPNGVGKTTLLRVLAGVLPPTSGLVLIQGRNPHVEAEAKALVGVAGHRPALTPRLSVLDNLRYWVRVLGLPAAERERRVMHVTEVLGLTEIAGQKARTISRGQTQRVGLAKALLADPPVLLLDEPTAGLDPGMVARLRDQLRLLADNGHTVLVSTHQLAEASEWTDDVTVLHQGRIVGRGGAADLRSQFVGGGRRLRLRGSGDLPGALAGLGYHTEKCLPGQAVVEVADEEAVEALIAGLVKAGIGIREVIPADNALEEVYVRLQAEGAGNGAR